MPITEDDSAWFLRHVVGTADDGEEEGRRRGRVWREGIGGLISFTDSDFEVRMIYMPKFYTMLLLYPTASRRQPREKEAPLLYYVIYKLSSEEP
jgi:hypothetical protein